MTPKISKRADGASTELTREPQTVEGSAIRSDSRFRDIAYWRAFFSHPSYDFAEAVVRLRRRRRMSQEELASAVGTQQPAIARLESGEANPRLGTLVEIARGLDACIRVQVIPFEDLAASLQQQAWYVSQPGQPATAFAQRFSVRAVPEGIAVFAPARANRDVEKISPPEHPARIAVKNNFALAG